MVDKDAMAWVDRAVQAVHREAFLPTEQRRHAGQDKPLPIGWNQTISQPSLVEDMTRALALTPDHRVLEVGTGSGYQTAILAEIAQEVFTIERIPELGVAARRRLERLGYEHIRFRIGDGALGWPEAAPFDAIVVTAAPPTIPPALVEQLALGGRLIIPVGADVNAQVLMRVTKDAVGNVTEQALYGVRFVPLI